MSAVDCSYIKRCIKDRRYGKLPSFKTDLTEFHGMISRVKCSLFIDFDLRLTYK